MTLAVTTATIAGPLRQCRDLADLYDRPELLRSTIDMARHRLARGQFDFACHFM